MASPRSLLAWAALGACILAGSAAGVGGFTFAYSKGTSYLTDDPSACANCHVMREQYDGWRKASHHTVAVCNDCHAPEGLLGKYATKAANGWSHSVAFTLGGFHEPIQITPRNRAVTEARCRSCHEDTVSAMDSAHSGASPVSCLQCHASVGHPQ